MSKYTTELRYVCEHYAGLDESEGYDKIAEIIDKARPHIFDQPYPIFDETYRSVLETKIIKHFYTREICAESVGLWKHWVDTKLNEIMPYYNQKYKSALLEYNPFYDVDLRTEADTNGRGNKNDSNQTLESKSNTRDLTRTDDLTRNTNIDETTNTNSSGENEADSSNQDTITFNEHNEAWKFYSDTPQGTIANIENNTYLTNATKDIATKTGSDSTSATGHTEGNYSNEDVTTRNETDEQTDERVISDHEVESNSRNKSDTNVSNYTNTEQYIQHVYGKRGTASYSKLLDEFRKTFLNIDVEIINEFNELFIQIY